VEFGGFWPILEAESGLALAPRGFGGRDVKMGKALSGAFFDFFHFLVGIGPELALFDPLFAPYVCRYDDASVGVFPPFSSALLHAFVGPDCQNGSAKGVLESLSAGVPECLSGPSTWLPPSPFGLRRTDRRAGPIRQGKFSIWMANGLTARAVRLSRGVNLTLTPDELLVRIGIRILPHLQNLPRESRGEPVYPLKDSPP